MICVAVVIEFSGLLHSTYLVQILVATLASLNRIDMYNWEQLFLLRTLPYFPTYPYWMLWCHPRCGGGEFLLELMVLFVTSSCSLLVCSKGDANCLLCCLRIGRFCLRFLVDSFVRRRTQPPTIIDWETALWPLDFRKTAQNLWSERWTSRSFRHWNSGGFDLYHLCILYLNLLASPITYILRRICLLMRLPDCVELHGLSPLSIKILLHSSGISFILELLKKVPKVRQEMILITYFYALGTYLGFLVLPRTENAPRSLRNLLKKIPVVTKYISF